MARITCEAREGGLRGAEPVHAVPCDATRHRCQKSQKRSPAREESSADDSPKKNRTDGLVEEAVALTKLVEERLDLAVLEQRGQLLRRLREVAHARRDGQLSRPTGQSAGRLQAPACGVAVLSLARVHVEVEVPHQRVVRRVAHLEPETISLAYSDDVPECKPDGAAYIITSGCQVSAFATLVKRSPSSSW